MTKLLIIGGVAGGATAAARARRLDEHAEIIVIERGDYVSFANCGLPYFIGGVIETRDALLVATPETFKGKYNVEVRVRSEALSIDREQRSVEIRDLKTGEVYRESYDKLILSPGAEPLRPPLEGVDLEGVFNLRSIPDSEAIADFVTTRDPRAAVVVGGGFIGLEMAENLAHRGLAVTIVEMQDQVLLNLDYEMAVLLHDHLRSKGVVLNLGDGLSAIKKTNDRLLVQTTTGQGIECDLVLLSIGVRPESKLAREAGLRLTPRGHIVVDGVLRTSDPNIFAVGDSVQVNDFVTGLPVTVALAGPANRQGRLAADNALGRRSIYRGPSGTAVVKVFDLVAGSTGPSERFLRDNRFPYLTGYTHSGSHASYYPGSEDMAVKLLFSPGSGRVLGAQIIGGEGVDKRIDVLATAIRGGLTVFDLEELDLAYAPPFSSAKDPVNVAGHVAANILKGDVEMFPPREVPSLDPARDVLVDLRFKEELDEFPPIDGALHIPLPQLRSRLKDLDPAKNYYLYCAIGLRGYLGHRVLTQNGFKSKNLAGGYSSYKPTA
ncbi:MAG: FAD-dependent oxidoreductase [Pseudomonadota bacterium]